jgi:hypothetical protein
LTAADAPAQDSGWPAHSQGDAMAQFTVNPQRVDPYKNFKFQLKWDGRVVAGVSHVGALHRVTEVLEFREGGNPSLSHRSPGVTRYEPITLNHLEPA